MKVFVNRIYTWKVAFFLMAGMLAVSGMFTYFVARPLGKTYASAYFVLRDTLDLSWHDTLSIYFSITVLISIFVFYAALLMSHRISGPVFRFERTAESMRDADFSTFVRLRDKDEMRAVEKELNLTLDEYRARLGKLKSIADEMHDAAFSGQSPDTARLAAASAMLRQEMTFFEKSKEGR